MNPSNKEFESTQIPALGRKTMSIGDRGSSSLISKTGILHKTKAADYKVYLNGEDVTPKPLDLTIFNACEERELNVVDLSAVDTSTTALEMSSSFQTSASNTARFKTETHGTDYNKSYMGRPSVEETFFLQSKLTETESEITQESSDKSDLEERRQEPIPIPKNISLILKETETFFILDIPSSSEIKGSDRGNAVETSNENYEYITVGKGKNRKKIDAMVQTYTILRKSRETDAVRYKRATHSTSASNWEMYDTFLDEKISSEEIVEEDESLNEEKSHALNELASIESFSQSSEEKQLSNLMKNENFLQAVTVIERLLANNAYNTEQRRFKGLYDTDVFRENIECKYELDLLWTFANDKTIGKSVTAISWNPSNEEIVAVGYGKFYFSDESDGILMIWNIKNPVQPERSYFYSESISAVSFSIAQPNLIAVGFNNGLIQVLDIRDRELKVVHHSSRENNASFETVNYLTFYSGDEHYNYEEQILACFNDGKICKYRLSLEDEMPCTQIMRAAEADGKVKGISKMTTCEVAIPLSKYTGALLITFHPVDPNIYYLCTNLGEIYKCSTIYVDQHLGILSAHDGPIYQMQFSPFCNRIYVTCGGDWYVRIWAEGITEPLLELLTTMHPVEYVLWSPTHSTILIVIQSSQIQIWDLHRKEHAPQNIINSPTTSRNTRMKFTQNGKCLTVCDITGNTHIYCLESMPIPPFFQDNLLYTTIKKYLIPKPELLKKFMSLKSMNFEKSSK